MSFSALDFSFRARPVYELAVNTDPARFPALLAALPPTMLALHAVRRGGQKRAL